MPNAVPLLPVPVEFKLELLFTMGDVEIPGEFPMGTEMGGSGEFWELGTGEAGMGDWEANWMRAGWPW